MIAQPKNSDTYYWTEHVYRKMLQYSISESVVKRVIRSPERSEKGIAPGTLAVMQSRGKKQKHEIWVMYQKKGEGKKEKMNGVEGKNVVITTWRYPGVSPVRETIPVPHDILEELDEIILAL